MKIFAQKLMNKVLLDTNILIYSVDEDSQYFHKAQKIILNSNLELFTTSKNLSKLLAVITRIPNSSLSIDEALMIIQDFMDFLTILYPSQRSFTIFQELLFKYKLIGLKIHDFEIISIALSNEINTIITLNTKDFNEVTEINRYPF